MNIELTDQEIGELIGLIESAWLDGFDDETLESTFEKLRDAQESME